MHGALCVNPLSDPHNPRCTCSRRERVAGIEAALREAAEETEGWVKIAAQNAKDHEAALLAARREGRAEGLEEAAKELGEQARAILACANTYERDEPGRPKETLSREAQHYLDAAEHIRALAGKEGA